MIVDAKNQILGRLASSLAQELQKGTEITVVNVGEAIVSGEKTNLQKSYKKKYDRGQRYFGPFFPRSPERILKRTVRGMLPKSMRGRAYLKNLKVYQGIPEQFKNEKFEKFDTENKLKKGKYLKLKEISKHLGSKVID